MIKTFATSDDPLVTIVIPTRSRATLLYYALRSAIAQTYANLEILVCDNDSSDDTPAVAKASGDPRVRYIRTPESLSMPDNWDFALKHVSGDFVTYLTDDSYLLPDTITRAMNALRETKQQVGIWRHAAYFAPDWLEAMRKNALYLPNLDGTNQVVTSESLVTRLFALDMEVATLIPKGLNSICSRDVIDEVVRVQGRLFLPSSPDYSSAASILLTTPSVVEMNWIGFLDGVTPASIGAVGSFNLGESNKKVLAEFKCDVRELVHLGIPTPRASIGTTLQNVKAFYKKAPSVNPEVLIARIIEDLARIEGHGSDVSQYWNIVWSSLSGSSRRRRATMRLRALKMRVLWRILVRARVGRYTRNIDRLRGLRLVDGNKAGFRNIEEAAFALPALVAG